MHKTPAPFQQKKKKKKLIFLISGILIITGIGTVVYFVWPKNQSTESKVLNSKQEIQKLQTQLNSLKSEINNLSDTTQKTKLESKLTGIENKIKNLSGQEKQDKSTIKNLEEKIKKIKKDLEDSGKKPKGPDEPDKDKKDKDKNPHNKIEVEVDFSGEGYNTSGKTNYHFSLANPKSAQEFKIFSISKNHPRIKELLGEGKLQEPEVGKKFILRYKKVDFQKGKIYDFNENNQELEIVEVKNPGPTPNPEPQPDNNKFWSYNSQKINDNTYKYKITLGGTQLSFRDFIAFSKNKKTAFFQAFQGALKDANAKFPAYFWKCPPVSQKTLEKPFEFVVIKSDTLNNIQQNYSSFQEYFGKSSDNQVVSFLGFNGGILISPVPKDPADYKNISQFTKNAPEEQQQALWKEVANKLREELEKDHEAPRWLNAEGLGVYYLHVRIDKTNRFYGDYPEYKNF